MDAKLRAAGLGLSLVTVIGLGAMNEAAQAQNLKDVGRAVLNDVLNNRNGNYENGRYSERGGGMQQLQMLDRRADRLSFRLRDAVNNGSISPRQFNWMNSQVHGAIAQIHDMRATGNVNFDQRNVIDGRLSRIESRLNMQTAGGPGGWH